MEPLTPARSRPGPTGRSRSRRASISATPLWYYILKEAQVRGNGERLGPVGARLVAEVFVGLVQGDKDSFLSQPAGRRRFPPRRLERSS